MQQHGNPCSLHDEEGDSRRAISIMSVIERVDGRCPIKRMDGCEAKEKKARV
jgi:hypothetical protein